MSNRLRIFFAQTKKLQLQSSQEIFLMQSLPKGLKWGKNHQIVDTFEVAVMASRIKEMVDKFIGVPWKSYIQC